MINDEMGWEDDVWIFADNNHYMNAGSLGSSQRAGPHA
jgi:hypothetical protein